MSGQLAIGSRSPTPRRWPEEIGSRLRTSPRGINVARVIALGRRGAARPLRAPDSRRAMHERCSEARRSTTTIGLILKRYCRLMSRSRVPGGAVHKLPGDLRRALITNPTVLDAWKDITPLARNEFICWVEDAKQETTRERRIRRTREELAQGQRRPCCWPGCKHRERTGA